MTFVVERSVSIDTPGSDVRSVHDDGRLVVSTAGRSVTFDTHVGVARVVEDTHQPGSAKRDRDSYRDSRPCPDDRVSNPR